MNRLGLFIKILLILLILVIVLPQIIDHIINIFIINEYNHKPRGNSTFVIGPSIKNNFILNLKYMIKCFMNS